MAERDRCPSNESLRGTIDILEDARVNGGDMPISAGKAIELCETVIALRERIATLEKERDEARQSNARLNRRAQEAEAAADRLAKIEARIAERDTRKPLPRMEAAFALAAAEASVATLEAALREAVELIDNASERTAASRLVAALRGLEGK